MKQLLTMTVTLILVLSLVVFWHETRESQAPAEALPINTRLGGDLVMVNQQGEDFDTASLRGQVVLLFFGFTHCPDICPATVARMTQVYKELEQRGQADQLSVVFITFDPERDTPEHLNEYLAWFHPDIIGLTGNDEQVTEAARRYGVVYLETDAEGENDYAFAHSDYVYLLDRQGRVRKLFAADAAIDEVLDDLSTLL